MTNFVYENEAQIRKLSRLLCVDGVVKRAHDKESQKVCKFLLSYWILADGCITRKIYDKIREEILLADSSKKNIIFFEKVKEKNLDFIYFQNYMKKMEKDAKFLDTWYTWFSKAA